MKTAVFISLLPLVVADCFFPDGTNATEDVPCSAESNDGGYVPCCSPDRHCLPNRLCSSIEGQDGLLSRGSCTDPTWQNYNCPDFCTTWNPGAVVVNCTFANGTVLNGEPAYCCGETSVGMECCNNTASLFTLNNWYQTMLSQSSTLSSATPSVSTEIVWKSSIVDVPSATPTSATSSPSLNAQSNAYDSPSNETSIGAGIGVGVGVPLIALLIGGPLLWRRRRRRRQVLECQLVPSQPSSDQWIFNGSNQERATGTRTGFYDDHKGNPPVSIDPVEMHTIQSPSELPGSEVRQTSPTQLSHSRILERDDDGDKKAID